MHDAYDETAAKPPGAAPGPLDGPSPHHTPVSDAFRVRRGVAADVPAIADVFNSAVRAEWTYLGDVVGKPLFDTAEWEQLVADSAAPNVLLVATDRTGHVVGYSAAHPRDGELFLLFVDPAHGHRGVGRMLLEATHDELRAAGCSRAFLYTHEQNERALAVYTRAGYRPDGTTRASNFRATAIREVRLVKQL
jgi:ribosomal protein S18 acetylase RimI-like enzyme